MVLASIVALGLTACSSSTKTAAPSTTAVTSPATTATASTGATGSATTAPSSPAAGTKTVNIKGFKFAPNPASGKVGDTITVTNDDNTNHTMTADDGSFDTGVFSSGSKTITLTKAGTFVFHCKIHNFMTGSFQVTA